MNVGHGWHLATRFAGSLRPGPPPPADDAWAAGHLNEGEQSLWHRMSNPDRRHAVGVARAVVATLGPAPNEDSLREVVAAALLHDVGKVTSGLGTWARVGATLVWLALDDQVATRWASSDHRLARRLGQYHLHPELGANLLADAGSHPLTVAWAREHHLSPRAWTIPADVGQVLKDCDDD